MHCILPDLAQAWEELCTVAAKPDAGDGEGEALSQQLEAAEAAMDAAPAAAHLRAFC